MTYTRSYPNDFTQNGTKVKKGFENDDAELKRIYGLLDSIGAISLASTKRQSVLYASTNNGEPSYLLASGLNVSLDGSTTNVLLAFAYGFNDKGAVDYIEKIAALVSDAWTLPSNSTVYLYIDRDISTNIISYGYSSLEDVYQKAAPTATLDQHWYDVNECKMKRYNGSSWESKQRIFVAKSVTTTDATTLTIYPLQSKAAQFVNINGNVIGNVTGNADTADKVNHSITVMGNAFDGSAAITIAKATQVQAEAGTDDATVMTPLKSMKQLDANIKAKVNASGDAPIFACRAWVNFDGTTTPPTITASGNVSSITKVATGQYRVNFTTPMSDVHYAPIPNGQISEFAVNTDSRFVHAFPTSVDYCSIAAIDDGNNAYYDCPNVSVVVFR